MSAAAILLSILVATPGPDVPTYPGARFAPIGDMVIGGRRHGLGYFTTPDSPAVAADWYAARWEREGFLTFVDGDASAQLIVSAYATREGLQVSVVLARHGSETLGFAVMKDLRTAVAPTEERAVRLEGGSIVAEVAESRSQQRTQIVPVSLEQAERSVEAALQARGATRISAVDATEGPSRRRVLRHTRDGDEIVTVLTEIDSRTTAVHQTWVVP